MRCLHPCTVILWLLWQPVSHMVSSPLVSFDHLADDFDEPPRGTVLLLLAITSYSYGLGVVQKKGGRWCSALLRGGLTERRDQVEVHKHFPSIQGVQHAIHNINGKFAQNTEAAELLVVTRDASAALFNGMVPSELE